jgi:hypothetical protein
MLAKSRWSPARLYASRAMLRGGGGDGDRVEYSFGQA